MRARSALVLACALAGCSAPQGPPLSVVLVVVDTLRADHLRIYGYPRATAPHLTEFASTAVVFDQAYTPASLTLPAHLSLMTGIHPSGHKVLSNTGRYAGPFPTLAELLDEAGYDTAAFVSGLPLQRASGMDRGFDVYRDARSWGRRHKAPGGDVSEAARRWLADRGDAPFFLFVHFYDVHPPYWRAADARFPFEVDAALRRRMEERGVAGLAMSEVSDVLIGLGDGEDTVLLSLPEAINVYDNEIHYVDQLIGGLVAALEAEGLRDRTLLVVTSDHGEGLGEHGYFQHDFHLYEEQIRVPLVLQSLGNPWPTRRVETPVSLLDLVPTLLDLLGLPAAATTHGRSLVPLLERVGEAEPRWIVAQRRIFSAPLERHYPRFSSADPLFAVRGEEPWKLLAFGSGAAELYRLDSDPGETRDLAATSPKQREALAAALEAERRRYETGAPGAAEAVDAETLEALKQLGYAP